MAARACAAIVPAGAHGCTRYLNEPWKMIAISSNGVAAFSIPARPTDIVLYHAFFLMTSSVSGGGGTATESSFSFTRRVSLS